MSSPVKKLFKYSYTKKPQSAQSTQRNVNSVISAPSVVDYPCYRLKQQFDVFPWGYPEWIDYYEQKRNLTATKTPVQKEVHSQVLQDVIKRVDKSFKNFFKDAGYPRFQGRNRYNSFTYPGSGFKLKDGKLSLSKIGNIKIILQRNIADLHMWV